MSAGWWKRKGLGGASRWLVLFGLVVFGVLVVAAGPVAAVVVLVLAIVGGTAHGRSLARKTAGPVGRKVGRR